jgi:hypothetical protein
MSARDDHGSKDTPEGSSDGAAEGERLPWALAEPSDVEACDIDGMIPPDTAADWHSLSDLFNAAANRDGLDPPQARVFRMLGSVLSMMLESTSPGEPFRPMLAWSDGRRSAATEDFRPCVDALVLVAERSTHPAVVSRAADVAWTLERRRHDMGKAALAAYCRLLDAVTAGTWQFQHETEQEGGRLGIGVLRRCTVIARSRSFGDQAPDFASLADRIEASRQSALSSGDIDRHLELAHLQLDYGLKEPAPLAADIERSVADVDVARDGHQVADALKVAASVYHRANDTAAAHAAQRRLSDVYVSMAESLAHSAMLSSGLMADAISALAGVRDAKDRRRELRHKLIDLQAGLADEMGAISHPLDIEDLRAAIAQQVDGMAFYDALFFFAMVRSSPDPAKERDDAIKSLRATPLSGLFAPSFHDYEGKKRHGAKAADGFGDVGDEANLQARIAQHQALSRQMDVGLLDAARRYIGRTYYIAPDVLVPALWASPFVPEGHENTFARGLASFLKGDATGALYILTPLVEAGLRWCLKSCGYEVTTFDDTDQTQEDKTLSALFRDQRSDIEAVLGDALTFNIDHVFLHPAGPAIRHAVAHGLLPDGAAYSPDAFYACWLVLHLCLMPLYPHRDELGLPGYTAPVETP